MEENLQFIYRQEFWYVSAFINTNEIFGKNKAEEIKELIIQKLSNLTDNDLMRIKGPNAEKSRKKIINMGKNIAIQCDWVPYFEAFPYMDKNKEIFYNTLGYFQFEVEYYKNESSKKEIITPDLLQQIPVVTLNILKEFCNRKANKYLLIDTESPIFVFITSNKTKPVEIQWTQENINKFKRVLGNWIEIYSGQWPDYSDSLYKRRIRGNLSNRLSELHYIRRNSGFIYMAEENYKLYFNSYIKKFVLDSTPKIRAMQFALISINESLDFLFLKRHSEAFMTLKIIEEEIKNLRYLGGMIQTKLSQIYNELDWNRRQHYTSVLKYLINEFNLDEIFKRVNGKFEDIYNSMQELYIEKSEENQRRIQRGLSLLKILFGAGVLADLAGVTMIALNLEKGNPFSVVFNGIIALIIAGIIIATIFYFIKIKREMKAADVGKTVDAVIEDDKGNIILIKRKYPPYKGHYALPGGFIKYDENPKQALFREVREETNLDVKIVKKIGIYDQPGRDPRGRIISTAFKCILISDISKMESGDDSVAAELVPVEELKNIDLAFDHKQILKDADVLK